MEGCTNHTPEEMALLDRFCTVSTGNLSDAMDYIGIPNGSISCGMRPLSPETKTMAGYACTMQQMPKLAIHAGKKMHRQIDLFNSVAQPGDVVVIDEIGDKNSCACGSMFVLRSQVRGIRGIVVNGNVRDVADIIRLGLPVFSTGVLPRSGLALETVSMNQPVHMGGVQIRPGDIVVGDSSGIVVIPTEYAEKILERAEFVAKVETLMEPRVLAGEDYKGLRGRVEAEVLEKSNQ